MKLHKLIPETRNPHTKIVLPLTCLIILTILFAGASAGSATASAGLQTEATTDPAGNGKPQQQQAEPAITLTATPFVYVSGVGTLIFNLSREGDTADSLDVTVNLTQEHGWLADTNHTATFAAGDLTTLPVVPGWGFFIQRDPERRPDSDGGAGRRLRCDRRVGHSAGNFPAGDFGGSHH